MKKFVIVILALAIVFAFTLPALAQKAAPAAPGKGLDNWAQGRINNPGQGQGFENWGQERRLENPGQYGFKVYPVPEPMTAVLILVGMLGVAGLRRKFRS